MLTRAQYIAGDANKGVVLAGQVQGIKGSDTISIDSDGVARVIGGGGGGVTQLIAGTNITLSPSNGLGAVTINSTGGGGGGTVDSVTGVVPITVNNSNPDNPVVSVSSASLSAAGVVQLSDSINSNSVALAATPSAVKQAYDLASTKVASPAVAGTANQVLALANPTTGATTWITVSGGGGGGDITAVFGTDGITGGGIAGDVTLTLDINSLSSLP